MRTAAILAAALLVGCGDNLADTTPDAPLVPDAPPPFAEAPHANVPQVKSGGGAVLTAPKSQPIFFTNDADVQAQIEMFLAQLSGSTYWSAVTSEYGVGSITNLPTIVTTDAPPTTDAALQTWIASKLDGTHTAEGWPATPDPQTIYSVYLPAGATFEGACTQYGAYHDELMAGTVTVPYALMPRCTTQALTIDTLTSAASHELVEAATDPYPFSAPAFARLDDEHFVWARTPGGETGDMCEYLQNADQKLVGGFTVQRTWSNASAAAGHDPCVPALATPYLGVAPMFAEDLAVNTHNGMIMTKGVMVPVNTSKTIEVDLFSDAPTTADWTVNAYDVAALLGTGQATLSFQWVTKATGHNGDKLQLMVTRTRMAGTRGSEMVLVAKADSLIVSMWWGYVAQ